METVRMGVFASSPSLIQSFSTYIAKSNDTITMSTAGLDEALVDADAMVQQGVEVIISRRGTAQMLREHLRIPVVSLPHRSFDIIAGLKQAAALGNRVLLPVFRQKLTGIHLLEELLSIELVQKIYHHKQSLADIITMSKAEGCEVVVGGDVTQNIAKQVGLHFVEIITSEEDIAVTVEDARSIALATRDEKAAAQRYRSIIEATSDGIVALDRTGRITAINSRAAAILGVSAHQVLGDLLTGYIAALPVHKVLDEQRRLTDTLVQIHNISYMVNSQPIILEEQVIGAVVTIRDLGHVVRSEQVVRHALSRGHIAKYRLESLVHESDEMQRVVDLAGQYAETDSTILVTGETGTGKEVIVHGIHQLSKRAKQPFVSLNCAALPAQLLESELFGHEEGAFTGSKKGGKAGRFELAHKGTIFLDEIDSTPADVQIRLLRVLQEKEVMRLGGDRIIPVDIRFIAAAGGDLIRAVHEGRFRADLYFRLNVLHLEIPPLRYRKKDIPLLLHAFSILFAKRHNLAPVTIPQPYIEQLVNYSWPGNVRQLRNFIERLIINCSLGDITSTLEGLLLELQQFAAADQLCSGAIEPHLVPLQEKGGQSEASSGDFKAFVKDRQQESEREMIQAALVQHRFSKSATAKALNISRTTLWRKIKEHELG